VKKGIVMEQQKEYMVVMTRDGKFYRAEKLEQAEVGMEVYFKIADEKKVLHLWTQVLRNNHTKLAVVAIVFLMMLFPVFSWYGNNQAYAYMNIDINPSVELELNEKMQVIDIIPQNREAEEIVVSLKDWKKKDASEVTFDMIEISEDKGFVNASHQVLIGISYLKEDFNQNYTKEFESFLTDNSEDISIATFLVPAELRKKAREQKISVNQMVADRIVEDAEAKEKPEVPVSVEDEDKEIIQSFYKEDSTEEEQESPEPSSEKTSIPESSDLKEDNHLKDQVPVKVHERIKEKKQAPGLQKKKENDKPGKAKGHQNKTDNDEYKNESRKEKVPNKTEKKEKNKKPSNKGSSKEKNKEKDPGKKHKHDDKSKHNKSKPTDKKENHPRGKHSKE
jgi:hypothetical protein